MRQVILLIGATVGGCAGGAIAALAVGFATDERPFATAKGDTIGKGAPRTHRVVPGLLANVRDSSGDGESAKPATLQAARDALSTAEVAPDPDEELSLERDAERERLAVEAIQREAFDPTWAPSTAVKLEGSLLKIGARHGFRVGEMDCRTASCMAQLSFSNRRSARAALGDVIHTLYEPNCAVAFRLASGSDSTGGVSARVRFNCERARIMEAEGP
jgi:hypothetical protein